MIVRLLMLALLLVVTSCKKKSDQPDPQEAKNQNITVIKNARIFDGTTGPIMNDGFLVIKDGKVLQTTVSVAEVAKYKGATVIDATGKTITPGLISAHVHLGALDADPSQYTESEMQQQLETYLRYGVTTVVSLGVNGDVFYNVKKKIKQGQFKGADLLGADRGFGVHDGVPPVKETKPQDRVYRPQTAAEVKAHVEEMHSRGTDYVKLWYDDNLHTMTKMTSEIYNAVIDESHKKNLKVFAHIYYMQDAKDLVRAGVDVLAHGIREGIVDDELVQMMKEKNVGYIPTLSLDEAFFALSENTHWITDPFFTNALSSRAKSQILEPNFIESQKTDSKLEIRKESLKVGQQNLKRLFDAGVLIGFGTDSGAFSTRVPGFNEHQELRLMVDSGLLPIEALRVATAGTAHILGLKDRGTLEPGMRADFLIFDSNPVDNINSTKFIYEVWQKGEMRIRNQIVHNVDGELFDF